jgi:uncharacterized membrane protein YphA (DoxX/SURF4 family)
MVDHTAHRIDDVRGSGIYPATGPFPPGRAPVRSPAALAHPEERQQPLMASHPMLEKTVHLTGRLIFGGYFLYNGINHVVNRRMLAAYARSKGVPAADMAVIASGLLITAGGLSILSGRQPKLGASLLMAFLLGVSPQMHAFWKEDDAQQRMHEMVNFTKNMALVGASLLLAAHPEPWPLRLPMRAASTAMVRGDIA